MPEIPELPPEAHEDPEPGELADPYDERDWDIARDGRMVNHADEPEPTTIPWGE